MTSPTFSILQAILMAIAIALAIYSQIFGYDIIREEKENNVERNKKIRKALEYSALIIVMSLIFKGW